jgi:hypothetical protein
MKEVVIIFVMAGVYALWQNSMRARERAVTIGKRACQRDGLQFLDDTVACISLKPARVASGAWSLRRIYRFEFSDTGNNRLKGTIIMTGDELEALDMENLYLETPGRPS